MLSSTVERIGRTLLLCMPTLLALAFYPNLEAPFTDAKTALFFAMTALIVAAWLATARRTYAGEPLASRLHLVALGIFAGTGIAYALSPWRYLGLQAVFWSLTGVLLFWAMRQLLWRRGQSLLFAIAAAGGVAAVIAAVQRVWFLDLFTIFGSTSVAPGRMALHGTLGNPDWLAAFLAFTLPATAHFALSHATVAVRSAWMFVSLLSLAMVVATGSRAGMLASALSLAVPGLLRGTRLVRTVAAGFALLLVALAVFAPSGLNPRSVATALHGRTVIWKTAVSDPAPKFLIGSGPGTFAYLYPLRMGMYFSSHPGDVRFASYERHAQNDFVETYAETGLVGVGFLVALLVLWAMLALRARHDSPAEASASLAALVALAALACFDFPLHRVETWSLAWMWLVLPVLVLDSRRELPLRAGRMTILPAAAVLALFMYAGALPVAASYRLATAQQQESLGDLTGAEESLRQATRIWPNATAHFDLVRILAKQERFAEALQQSQVAERWIAEPELFLLRSRILRALGRENDATRTIEQSAARFPYSKILSEELARFSGAASGSVAPR